MLWEYTTFDVETKGVFRPDVDDAQVVRMVNRYGASGWELVSVVPVLTNGYTHRCVFVLKRPRQQQSPMPALPITE
jgi:hypothetical protein